MNLSMLTIEHSDLLFSPGLSGRDGNTQLAPSDQSLMGRVRMEGWQQLVTRPEKNSMTDKNTEEAT
jgi:hypothetical protein